MEFCCFINTSQYKHTPSTWYDKFSFCQLACNYPRTCAQNGFLQARICSRVAVWYTHCQSDISGDIGESTSTTSGASAPDDKTATVQYKPATSLAGNNALAHYEQSRGYDQISHALSNIHGLYGWSCNLLTSYPYTV